MPSLAILWQCSHNLAKLQMCIRTWTRCLGHGGISTTCTSVFGFWGNKKWAEGCGLCGPPDESKRMKPRTTYELNKGCPMVWLKSSHGLFSIQCSLKHVNQPNKPSGMQEKKLWLRGPQLHFFPFPPPYLSSCQS